MALGDMNNYEGKQLKFERSTFDLCNNVQNQCLQELVKLNFTPKAANELFTKG